MPSKSAATLTGAVLVTPRLAPLTIQVFPKAPKTKALVVRERVFCKNAGSQNAGNPPRTQNATKNAERKQEHRTQARTQDRTQARMHEEHTKRKNTTRTQARTKAERRLERKPER